MNARIVLKWASTSISGERPGHSWRLDIIAVAGTFLRAKLLNECKLFPYNQLSSFEIFGPVAVAQRVHYGTDITTWE